MPFIIIIYLRLRACVCVQIRLTSLVVRGLSTSASRSSRSRCRVVPKATPRRSSPGARYVYNTHPFNGPLSGTTRVSRYQKGKTNLDFTEARDSESQWHQLGHMQVCTSLQTDNRTPAPHHSVFYRPDALPVAQPTTSKY